MKMKHTAANSKSILSVTARVDLFAFHRVLRRFPPCLTTADEKRSCCNSGVINEFLSHVVISSTVVLGPWHQGWSTRSPIDLKIAGSFDSLMLTPGLMLFLVPVLHHVRL